MKNSLMDLNNHLFAMLEKLNDDDLSGKELDQEINRAKAISGVADKIIATATVSLEAEQLKAEYGGRNFEKPAMIEKKNA